MNSITFFELMAVLAVDLIIKFFGNKAIQMCSTATEAMHEKVCENQRDKAKMPMLKYDNLYTDIFWLL